MPSLTELSAASSVAAADQLAINQSGTDKRVTADKFAIVGAANAATSFGGVSAGGTGLGVSKFDSKFLALRSTEHLLADDAVWLVPATFAGFLDIYDSVYGNWATVFLNDYRGTVHLVAKSAGVTLSSDPDGSLNIYWDSGNSRYAVRNRLGGLTGLRVIVRDMRA